jgi:hypothetical protein
MGRILFWIGAAIGLFFLLAIIAGLFMHEPKPESEVGLAADALARRMMAAVDSAAWDSTAVIAWTFSGARDYLWDRERDLCRMQWGNNEVLLDLQQIKGKAWRGRRLLEGKRAERLVRRAWSRYCNDSFWLYAPMKAFDPGVVRGVVSLPEGDQGLLVRYTSGGVTPGDSYLWQFGEDDLPKAWKLWVQIVPVGGTSFTWEDWITLSTGAKVATTHRHALHQVRLSGVEGATSLAALGYEEDPFSALLQ